MRNLHLMPMGSVFEDDLVCQLNGCMPPERNLFILAHHRPALDGTANVLVDPDRFGVDYINRHCSEYHRIVLHSLYLSPGEILALSDEAAGKIIWCVWGHDLYDNRAKSGFAWAAFCRESIHACKKLLRGTYIRMYRDQRRLVRKVSMFHAIAIGFFYDEVMIRKKYGHTVPVRIAPYFSGFTREDLLRLRQQHLQKPAGPVNILIGHSGFPFLEHEKYLRLLSRYSGEDICINMVLSYGADPERIEALTGLAHSLFGPEKCRILTEMMPKDAYYDHLARIDIAVFGYKHQSALANTKVLAGAGAKLYLHPQGVLAKGFRKGGVLTSDCREIGSVPFARLCENRHHCSPDAPLFDTYDHCKSIRAWQDLLS